jgi:hypothetical protein
MQTVREIAKGLKVNPKVAMAKMSEFGEFISSPDVELQPSTARKLKDALGAPQELAKEITYKLGAPRTGGPAQEGSGEGQKAGNDPAEGESESESEGAGEASEDDAEAEGAGDSDSEDEADADTESSQSRQDEFDLSESESAGESETPNGEQPKELPVLYLDFNSATLADFAVEANCPVNYLVSLLENTLGYDDVNADMPANQEGGGPFVTLAGLLGYRLLDPSNRPDNDIEAIEHIGFYDADNEVRLVPGKVLRIGDAVFIIGTGYDTHMRVKTITDAEGFLVPIINSDYPFKINNLDFKLRWAVNVYRAPNDRMVRLA